MSRKRACSLLQPPLPPAQPGMICEETPQARPAAPRLWSCSQQPGLLGEEPRAFRDCLGFNSRDSRFPEAP